MTCITSRSLFFRLQIFVPFILSDVRNTEAPTNNQEDLTFNGNCANDMEEDILNEMFNETLEVS